MSVSNDWNQIRREYNLLYDHLAELLNLLFEYIQDELARNAGYEDRCDWAEAWRHHGIYVITRRVKQADRLVAKLKREETATSLDCTNFHAYAPDILGLRIVFLHPKSLVQSAIALKQFLLQDECFIKPQYHKFAEKHAKVRRHRFSLFTEKHIELLEEQQFTFKIEEVGYSSIHLLLQFGPKFSRLLDGHKDRKQLGKLFENLEVGKFIFEIQLRTILEEAWGEIDHWIRYEKPELIEDEDLKSHFCAMSAYLQAGNHHIQTIQELAKCKMQQNGRSEDERYSTGCFHI